MVPSNLETHAITSHARQRPRPEKSGSRILAENCRAKLLARLEAEDAEDLATPLARCGEELDFTCTCCGERTTFSKRCNRKWCPACQRALATRASLKYEGITATMQWPLFVTLTVKNWPDTSIDFVRHLRRAFGKLRRLRWWTARVKGGIAGIEVTNTGKGWHPHLHAVLDCKWLAVHSSSPPSHLSAEQKRKAYLKANKEVCEQWSLCTGLPSSVKTKRAYARDSGTNKSIATEVIKYSVKGSDLVECKEEIAPVLRMLDRTRLLTSFGSCYGRLSEFKAPRIPCACDKCGTSGAYQPTEVVDRMLQAARRWRRRK